LRFFFKCSFLGFNTNMWHGGSPKLEINQTVLSDHFADQQRMKSSYDVHKK